MVMLVNKEKKKELIIYFIAILFSVLYIFVGNKIARTNTPELDGGGDMNSIKAKVIEITDRNEDVKGFGITQSLQSIEIEFKAIVLSGENKGEEILCLQTIGDVYENKLKEVEQGDKVLLYPNTQDDSSYEWFLGDYIRFDAMIWLSLLFFLAILVFGRKKGLNTIVSLVFTCLAVFMVFIPSIISGKNIYFWSILTCIYITIMTLIIVNGANKKSLAAGVGCCSGVLVAGIITLIMDKILSLTGFLSDETGRLLYINEDNPIDLRALIFAAIIIGAVGAIMDVAMSISSALQEIGETGSNVTPKQLIKSGLTIGRDIMGTMANTLVLAYIGSSLSIVVLFAAYSHSMLDLMNMEMIIVEMLQAIAGSLGILMTIPLTTITCSVLYKKEA